MTAAIIPFPSRRGEVVEFGSAITRGGRWLYFLEAAGPNRQFVDVFDDLDAALAAVDRLRREGARVYETGALELRA